MPRLDANDLELLRRVLGYLEQSKDPAGHTVLAGKFYAICESVPGDRDEAVKRLVIADARILENAARPEEPHTREFLAAAAIVRSELGAPL